MTTRSAAPDHAGAVGLGAVRELVIKLHERCNIACDYCYMYEAADQHWRHRPVAMSPEVVDWAARRLAEHAQLHGLPHVRVVLHGGEPLLAGPAGIERTVENFRSAMPPGTRVSFAVQTNGLLLTERVLTVLRRQTVRVGVSLDGDRAANDRHRRDGAGRSTYEAAVSAIGRLRQDDNRAIYGGLLCTVDVRNDPLATYDMLLAHEPPRIDFLLPHGNWTYPPPGLDPRPTATTAYADWLIAIFDRWYDAPRRETRIRLFDSLISLLLGGPSETEAVGLGQPAVVVVESDGSIEASDALKTTGPAGGATGLTVRANTLDDALAHPLIAEARQGLASLGPECRRCPAVRVCGGGLHAHRYSAGRGFARPSVYCADLFRLIGHIRARLEADIARLRVRVVGVGP